MHDAAASYDQLGELHGAVAPAVTHDHHGNDATQLLARLKAALKTKLKGGSGEARCALRAAALALAVRDRVDEFDAVGQVVLLS